MNRTVSWIALALSAALGLASYSAFADTAGGAIKGSGAGSVTTPATPGATGNLPATPPAPATPATPATPGAADTPAATPPPASTQAPAGGATAEFSAFDVNGNGQLSLDEVKGDTKLKGSFKQMDKDRNGSLSRDEYSASGSATVKQPDKK